MIMSREPRSTDRAGRAPSTKFQHAVSRFARCTPGVIDRCVVSVASEVADLTQIILGSSAPTRPLLPSSRPSRSG